MTPSFQSNTDANSALNPQSPAAARTPLEEELVNLWQRLLEVPEIGIHDDFFDLGGHSLLAIEIRGQIRKTLSAPHIRVDLLDTPTVASMASSIMAQLTKPA